MKRAIVLSGGGSKGSYQIGVWKALRKLHIKYDIITGTSVGALNGSLMVQKSFYKAKKLWENLTFNNIFNSNLDANSTSKNLITEYGKNILQNGGMDITNLENLLKKSLKPSKFFNSPINYGLVTYNLSNHQAISKKKSDMTKDNLFDYIIASATCFPAFQKKNIDGASYIDGGYYDNLPINLAIDMGANEIIAIDLKAIGLRKKTKDETIPITYISPKNEMVSFLIFDGNEAKKGIKYGYNDTMKTFNRLEGNYYTFKKGHLHKNYLKYQQRLITNLKDILQIDNNNILDDLLKITIYKRVLNENKLEQDLNDIIEGLGKNFKLDNTTIYKYRKFNKLLKKQLNNINKLNDEEVEQKLINKNFNDLLNTRWITLYLYNKIINSQDDKTKKDLTKLAIVLPKEFLKALYLYTINN